MRAIVITEPDKAGNISLVEREKPAPCNGEVLVDVAYAGCNFADTMCRRGTYPHPIPYPFVPGFEISGTISALGEGVTALKAGDRVCGYIEDGGCYAEHCVARPEQLTVLPDEISFDVGAAFRLQGTTAWHMLHTTAKFDSGHPSDGSKNVLVNAIGGGVGLFATQIARHMGATVFGTVGSDPKAAKPLEMGAVQVFNRHKVDFTDEIMKATNGEGVDLVLDSLGGETLDKSFACTRPLGHVISYGEAEARPYDNIWERCLRKSLTFSRIHLGHIESFENLIPKAVDDLLAGFASGWLKAPIADVYPLGKALDMQLALESGTVPGKLLLEIGGG